MRRIAFPVLLGVVGVAILLALGQWQVRRLAWKTAILDRIEATIGAAPVPLPEAPDPEADRYRPVTVAGTLTGEEAPVLIAVPEVGPAVRVVAALATEDGRRVLVDLGTRPDDAAPVAAGTRVAVEGNLHWPQETDSFTPDPDLGRNLWFARDVPRMAEALGTEPVMVVARTVEPPVGTTPMPVGVEGIANNHLQYAITWFSLAAVWAALSAWLAWRTLHPAPPARPVPPPPPPAA